MDLVSPVDSRLAELSHRSARVSKRQANLLNFLAAPCRSRFRDELGLVLRVGIVVLSCAVTFAGAGSIPFQSDEVMDYEVRWKPPLFLMPSVRAGLTTLRVHPQTTYDGRPAFQFAATVKSDGFFTRLGGIHVNDAFDSIVSADNFCARKIVKVQREGSRQRDVVITFDPEKKTTRVVETNVALSPPRITRDETLPLADCVVDILSIFYAARRLDLEVGKSFDLLLSDNGTTRPVTITVQGREPVETARGTVSAVRIHTGSAMGLFSRGGVFVVWYSDDELKIPVRFEASVRFGKIFGWLTSYQGSGKLKIDDRR